jgi:acid stress-induced BolA-like protein IbaG/YrbA
MKGDRTKIMARALVTLDGTYAVAQELAAYGDKPASLKLALWGATLSAQKTLHRNIAQVQPLLPYVHKPLNMTAKQVQALIASSGERFVSENNGRYILDIERMEQDGELDALAVMPTTPAAWLVWRERVAAIRGMSYKTASFAALLMWPLECPLVPVDSHVCARLGRFDDYTKSSRSYKVYASLEDAVTAEWVHAGQPRTLGVWHWYKWSEWRQMTDDEVPAARPETHNGLSPRAY